MYQYPARLLFAMSSWLCAIASFFYIPPYVVLRESVSTVRARAHSVLKLRGLTMHRWFDYKRSLRMWRRKARGLKKRDEQGIGEEV